MKIKSNLVKFTTAAALSVLSISAVDTVKQNFLTSTVKAATTKVIINNTQDGQAKVWNNYTDPQFTGTELANGETVDVLQTALDNNSAIWYEIGPDQWIKASDVLDASPQKHKKTKKVHKSVASKVVSLAKKQVGKSYVYGSAGPNSFDCSGLTSYVYSKAAGKQITRTTTTQVKQGKKVSLKKLKPGDLLFWGSASAPYHVGIYVGGNKYVHAATPSQGVVKQTISSYFYPSVAKRIL